MPVPVNNNDKSIARNVWCILGLPFDSINMKGAIDKVHASAINKTPCFISTPNLNFLIECQKDSEFRNSVINSDLSVVDGKPLVWMARLLNIPISERVAGSNLIEELIENKAGYKPLKIFFFGGEEGVGEIACKKLNASASGLRCVGNLNPGFGSIEEMSSGKIIDQINQSDADFIIVSLGAKKGQAWIEKNRKFLNAPIISHLGAVVNFIAGTVNRSPKFIQKIGLEWLWRIKEEPALWKRYFFDGVLFILLFIFKVIPLTFLIRFRNKTKNIKPKIFQNGNILNIELDGYCDSIKYIEIDQAINELYNFSGNVEITLKKDSYVDLVFIARLQLLKNKLSLNDSELHIISKSRYSTKLFHYSCCDYLLVT